MDLQIQAFVANPTEAGLQAARQAWIEARKPYGITEVYRFYDGPIEVNEGAINGWPLDEVYIDYVANQWDAGIINNPTEYASLLPEDLLALNEEGGEKNLATGWHAIEFLLWGQDFSKNGPGNRQYTDYTEQGTKLPNDAFTQNADRRKAYLSSVSSVLVQQLQEVADAWNPSNKEDTNYVNGFVTGPDSFKAVVAAAQFLANDELAKERMLVAWESQAQEDEHSCFSDTTSTDLYMNFKGIQNVLSENYDGVSFISILKTKDAKLAGEIETSLKKIDDQFKVFPKVFDQAIKNQNDRVLIKQIIDDLMVLGDQVGAGLTVLN
jgi:putative iron-regulated protein